LPPAAVIPWLRGWRHWKRQHAWQQRSVFAVVAQDPPEREEAAAAAHDAWPTAQPLGVALPLAADEEKRLLPQLQGNPTAQLPGQLE
jgi:hypothetical protein